MSRMGSVPQGSGAPASPELQDFPTVGLIDGRFRQDLEELGMGYGLDAVRLRSRRAAAMELIQAIRDAAVAVDPSIIVLCHGGPIAEPEDTQYVLDHTTGVAGFFGASSMERLPTEVAITENMRRFKLISCAVTAAR